MNNKVPVFIHIPRSAGTYIYNANKISLRFFLDKICDFSPSIFTKSNDFRFIYRFGKKFPCMEINIQEEGKTIFTVFCTETSYNYSDYSNFVNKYNQYKLNEDDLYNIDVLNIDALDILNKDIDIFSIIIQPRGIKYLKEDLFEGFFDKEINFKFYLPIRDPIQRLKSLFFYLKSQKSAHEPTHNIYKSKTFEEFVLKEAPDNWIIKQFMSQTKEDEKTTEDDFIQVSNLLEGKNFLIYEIKNVDNMLDIAFRKYNFSFIRDITDLFKRFLFKFNKNNKNEWKYEFKTSDAYFEKIYKDRLSEITKYEYKLYKLATNK